MENEKEFIPYMKSERDTFVNKINSQAWNTELRCAAEDFLIAYDQMMDELKEKFRLEWELKQMIQDINKITARFSDLLTKP